MQNNINSKYKIRFVNSTKKITLRSIFLNVFVCLVILICYIYASLYFGSISTNYITNSKFYISFGITLSIFGILSILKGKIHGFISGFFGELLYELAVYQIIYLHWCLIVAFFGFLCGIYKYRASKYQKIKNILFTYLVLIISSLLTTILIIVLLKDNYLGLKFFIQALISVIIPSPLLLFLFDKALSTEERHVYVIPLTHHPISMMDHTFYIKFGKVYTYFCSRCSGVIIGATIAVIVIDLTELILNVIFPPEFALISCIVLPIPGLIDWGTQRLLLRKSTTESRLFTGFIIGMALYFMSLTGRYYFFTIFLLILYFSIFGVLVYFGHKKEIKNEMKLLNKDLDELHNSEAQ